MNKNFKCVVFDLDGTLIDSGPDLLDSLNFVLKKNNLKEISGDVIGNLVGGGAEAMIRRGYAFLGEKLDNKMIPKLIKTFLQYYQKNCTKKTKLYPNVMKILILLKSKNIKVCICTNKKQYLAEKIIQNMGLNKYFDLIVGSQNSMKLKPHPDMLNKCVDSLNVQYNETIFIGDSLNDIVPANELGIVSVFVTYGYGKMNTSVNADIEISDIMDLKSYF